MRTVNLGNFGGGRWSELTPGHPHPIDKLMCDSFDATSYDPRQYEIDPNSVSVDIKSSNPNKLESFIVSFFHDLRTILTSTPNFLESSFAQIRRLMQRGDLSLGDFKEQLKTILDRGSDFFPEATRFQEVMIDRMSAIDMIQSLQTMLVTAINPQPEVINETN